MEFKFIAINGDNVGDSIGSAIASDNHEELSKLTGGLKDAHSAIEEWVASVGGETVTSSGDEGIYKIPAESYDEGTIEGLRDQYSQTAGTTLTIGVGSSMSEASKALIYGKLNDKDQIVEYDSSIDDYIASHDEEASSEMPIDEDAGEDESGEMIEEDTDGDGDVDKLSLEDSTDENEDGEADITVPADEMVDEHEKLVDTLESPEHEDDIEEADEQSQELEQYKDVEESGEDAFISEDDAEADMEAVGSEDETLSEEGEMSEDDLDTAPEDKLNQVIGEDLDGDGDIDSMKPSEALGEEEGMDEEGAMGGADIAPEDAAALGEEEGMDEGADNQDAIADMIHANMGEEGDGEMDGQEEGSDDELRQDIVNSLQTFKENKPMLEQAKTQNPKLYEATILMLRSMIEMAKKLNMNPMADAEGQEVQDAMPEADMIPPEEGEEAPESVPQGEPEPPQSEGEDETQQAEEDEAAEEGKKKMPFQKSEMTKLYADLMKGMKVLQKFGGDPKRPRQTVKLKGTPVTQAYHEWSKGRQIQQKDIDSYESKNGKGSYHKFKYGESKKVDKAEKPVKKKQ